MASELAHLQADIKRRFPEVAIMRSIPIPQAGITSQYPSLEIALMFETVSDYFLTDTLVSNAGESDGDKQPVQGFVGITGETCDWKTAAKLVEVSGIPVILAGGISPENVLDGIRTVAPAGVDSCTLTNTLDGDGQPVRFSKDCRKVTELVTAVRRAEQN